MVTMTIGEFARRSRLSPKALRLYDDLGLLSPAHVDDSSGYRHYEQVQLERARLIAALRRVECPLAMIKELLDLEPHGAAAQLAAFWSDIETQHKARRDLVNHLVEQMSGKKTTMFEVAIREIPERSILCLKRHVDEQGAWTLGKEFIAILRDRPLPRLEGRSGAMFSIYWGEVSADSDGPVEWCKPIAANEAESVALHYPELTLRTEPAHREAFVALGLMTLDRTIEWQVISDELQSWAKDQGIDDQNLSITPDQLGVRVTYLATDQGAPDGDFAVPFA